MKNHKKQNSRTVGRFYRSVALFSVLMMVACLWPESTKAQKSYGGTPISASGKCSPMVAEMEIPKYTMQTIDIDSMLRADSIPGGNQLKQVGVRAFTNIDEDDGLWNSLTDGSRIWRVEIASPDARAIIVYFDEFEIPAGAKMFAYSPGRAGMVGAFTHKNNKPHGQFAIGPILSDRVIIEYNEPAWVTGSLSLRISGINHLYAGFRGTDQSVQGFNNSLGCHNDAVCQTNYCAQRRAVVLLLIPTAGGCASCSGALVRNQMGDKSPWILSAWHCLDSNSDFNISQAEENNLWTTQFLFNYEQASCSSPSSSAPLFITLTGANFYQASSASDHAIIRMDSRPPVQTDAFYAGWDCNDTPVPLHHDLVSIHHPAGDVKKVSNCDCDALHSTRMGDAGNMVQTWWVDWGSGNATEGGSSGGPLFNENKRICGVVSGGPSSCGSGTHFGRLGVAWRDYGLDNILDPSDVMSDLFATSDGFYNCQQNLNLTVVTQKLDGFWWGGQFDASNLITAGGPFASAVVDAGENVELNAGVKVRLISGFHAKAGSNFSANITGYTCFLGQGCSSKDEEHLVENSANNTSQEPAAGQNDFNVKLFNIFPNPFAGVATIEYSVDKDNTNVTIEILNMTGESVAKPIVNLNQNAGIHRVEFDGTRLAASAYFCKLQTADDVSTKRVIITE